VAALKEKPEIISKLHEYRLKNIIIQEKQEILTK